MNNNSYIDFIKEKEKNREDKGNIYCTGISEREFIKFAIKYLLGDKRMKSKMHDKDCLKFMYSKMCE